MSSHCGGCLIGVLSYGCIRTVSLVMVADSFLSFETGLLFIFIFSRVGFVSCDALRNSRSQELGCTTMSDYGVQRWDSSIRCVVHGDGFSPRVIFLAENMSHPLDCLLPIGEVHNMTLHYFNHQPTSADLLYTRQ